MKKEEKQQILIARLHEMQEYERGLREKGVNLIAGVDEVGRGPLAGPVVAAAVILPENFSVLGVDDSKKLSEKRREQLFDEIKKEAIAYCMGVVDNNKIDKINILEATKLAMKQAIYGLSGVQDLSSDLQRNSDFQKSSLNGLQPEHILIDALVLKDVDIPQTGIIKGDSKSVSIAAASILAKVTRDRMMVEYHKTYSDYAFDRNKGYGTKAHYEGIKKIGICPLHRRTFLHLKECDKKISD